MINYKEKYNLGLFQSPYDSRDWKFKDVIPMGAVKIPDNYETEDSFFTYDQGTSSQCAASSKEYIRFLQEREQSGLTQKFNPTFAYGDREDNDYKGEGMYLREIAKQATRGSVLYSEHSLTYPCSVSKALKDVSKNKESLYELANPFATTSYYTCTTRKEIQTAIITTKAVQIGIPVYDCFYEPDVNGNINYDISKLGTNNGGHAIALRGWKTDENGKLWWLVKNSWGSEWGINGCCWLPEEYPWMDNAYVYVDEKMEITFEEYKKKFGK